jgi:two-component system, NarL family, nitrate/nitrite response regulator NarL
MSLSGKYEARAVPSKRGPAKVTAFAICKSSVFRGGLMHMLAGTRFLVLGEAFNERSGLPAFPEAEPVLFIIDANCHSDMTPELVRHVKAQCSHAKIVVLADQFELSSVRLAHEAGANGFCQTRVSCEVLAQSLELVMLGETVFPSDLFLSMMSDTPRHHEHQTEDRPVIATRQPSDPKSGAFSDRELTLLRFLTEGAPNKAIARKLDVAEVTVKGHVKAILKKIGVENRTQAAIWASDYLPRPDASSGSEPA